MSGGGLTGLPITDTTSEPGFVLHDKVRYRRTGSRQRKIYKFGTVTDGNTEDWTMPMADTEYQLIHTFWFDSADTAEDVTTNIKIQSGVVVDNYHPLSAGKPANSLTGIEVQRFARYSDRVQGTLRNNSGGDLDDMKLVMVAEVLEYVGPVE